MIEKFRELSPEEDEHEYLPTMLTGGLVGAAVGMTVGEIIIKKRPTLEYETISTVNIREYEIRAADTRVYSTDIGLIVGMLGMLTYSFIKNKRIKFNRDNHK